MWCLLGKNLFSTENLLSRVGKNLVFIKTFVKQMFFTKNFLSRGGKKLGFYLGFRIIHYLAKIVGYFFLRLAKAGSSILVGNGLHYSFIQIFNYSSLKCTQRCCSINDVLFLIKANRVESF